MDSDFRNAEVGMRVWCIGIGSCQIVNIDHDNLYPITVTNMEKTEMFTLDGKSHRDDKYPSLFHEKPECFKPKAKKTVEPGEPLFVEQVGYIIRNMIDI